MKKKRTFLLGNPVDSSSIEMSDVAVSDYLFTPLYGTSMLIKDRQYKNNSGMHSQERGENIITPSPHSQIPPGLTSPCPFSLSSSPPLSSSSSSFAFSPSPLLLASLLLPSNLYVIIPFIQLWQLLKLATKLRNTFTRPASLYLGTRIKGRMLQGFQYSLLNWEV